MKGGVLNMEIKHEITASGKDFYFVVDDNGKIVVPIFSYLKHLAISNLSKLLSFNDFLEVHRRKKY